MLVQNQYNGGSHDMKTIDGKTLRVSSTHHQAQYPFNMEEGSYKILGWTENLSPYHEGGEQEELNPPKECEVVEYTKTKDLGIQLHPEYLPYGHETNVWLRSVLNKFMNEND